MANQVLIQTRLSAKQAKKLDKLQKKAEYESRAEFVRQILTRYIEDQERLGKN